eukprot:COSAG05_NODE_652_length_8074_cov_668.123009_2_plen_135_part_00
MRLCGRHRPTGWHRLCGEIAEALLPCLSVSCDAMYAHPYTHARAPVLAAEALGNLALHNGALSGEMSARVTATAQAVVASPSTSDRLYPPALEALRRMAVLAPIHTRCAVGTTAARRVLLGRWGLVDQQNNRGW